MRNQPDPVPAALYARVSSDRQDVDLSVAAQLRALRNYAAQHGYVVAREYVDEAESGRIAARPQFRAMLDETSRSAAPFAVILVWKFSRFTRKREHAVAFKALLRRRGVKVVSITEHADDSPTGKLMEAIIESVDEFYSENLAQEVTRGMREAAARGFWMASRAPYGYSRVLVPDGAKQRPKLAEDHRAEGAYQRGLHRHAGLGSQRQRPSAAGTGTGRLSRPRRPGTVPARGHPAGSQSTGQGPSPAVRQLLPAQWVGHVPALWAGALRAGGQAGAVRLLRLPVAAAPGERGL